MLRRHENTTLAESALVRTQEDVAALEGCEVIEGNLFIDGPGVNTLQPLYALRAVRGGIHINTIVGMGVSDPTLPSLEGLESLESVAQLSLSGLIADNVDPLRNLQILTNGDLEVRACPNLTNLDGLAQLQNIRQLSVNYPWTLPPSKLSLPLFFRAS